MTSSAVAGGSRTVNDRNSVANLLRLFKVEPNHWVITRQDLIRDYEASTSSVMAGSGSSSQESSSDSTDSVTINHYYTWNSSRTNAPIHKERAAIISALHSRSKSTTSLSAVRFSSSLSSYPTQTSLQPSKSFTRSHRVRDIVFMCSDERCTFSADEYHNDQVTAATAEAAGSWPPDNECRQHHDVPATYDWLPISVRDSDCWSCEATDGSSDDGSDDNNKNTMPPLPSSQSSKWKRRLSRLFKKKRDRR